MRGRLAQGGRGGLSLNTDGGRAFLAERIADYEAESGLNFRVGRIQGSIFGRMVIHDLQIRDRRGPFIEVPKATLDWRPLSLLSRKIDLRELDVPMARVLRRPTLKETPPDPERSLLPNIDIAAPKIRVNRIVFERPFTGRRHVASLMGTADLADGRAQLDLRGAAVEGPNLAGGDRLRVIVDVVPDANRLIADVELSAPEGGLVDSYLGLGGPLLVSLGGRGDWAAWEGQAQAQLGHIQLGRLDLSARDGLFRIRGRLQPGRLIQGPTSRLLQPALYVDAQGTLVRRRLEGLLTLRSDALVVTGSGAVNLEANRLHELELKAQLLEPGALAANLSGRDVRLALTLNGRFSRLAIGYELSAAALAFGDVRVEDLTATGRSRANPDRILIPVEARAGRVSGLNAAAGDLLTNLRIEGDIALSDGRVLSDNLRLRSDRIDATAVIAADLSTGQYNGAFNGRVNDYAVEGLGRFNLVTDARLTGGRTGGFGLRGSVKVNSRRLDNDALRDLFGGQAELFAGVELRPSGEIVISRVRLTAPDFQILSGEGVYDPGGRIDFRGTARSSRYGPLLLTAGGTAQQPVIRLTAASPQLGLGLRDVVVEVTGGEGGYRTELRGTSDYGGFTGQAAIRPGRPLTIDVASFRVAGVTLSGQVRQTAAGPFAGTLRLQGSGLDGAVRLGASGEVQRADVALTARQATLDLNPTVTIGSGRLTGAALLYPDAPAINLDLSVASLRRGDLRLSAARARAAYRAGAGNLGLVAHGRSRGAPFNVVANANLTPRLIRANVEGAVNGVRLRLAAPAHIRKTRDGWRLEFTRLLLPKGELLLAGQTGRGAEITAQLRNVDLSVTQAIYPQLALEGAATGRIEARLPAGSGIPTIRARVDVDNFSRVSLATESAPVDIGLRGGLSGEGGSLDALVRRGGATIGRMQARMSPLAPPAGGWTRRLMSAPLSGGVRFSGPADVLWAFTGISGHEVSGPIALAADFGGQVRQPTLNGVIRADALRYANPTYATSITNIAVRGRFTESRLEITSLTGHAGRGSVTARGWVELGAATGFPMDVRVNLNEAQLASNESLGASASGTLAITNSRQRGALVQGELRIPEARYRIVRQGAAEVPILEGVRRRGSPPPTASRQEDNADEGFPGRWRLDIRVRAENRLFVSSMGLDAEWSANLRVRGTAEDPRVTGNLELLRGAYTFAGRRLDLTRADVRFDGGRVVNPLIDIAASTKVEGVTATVNVTGRAQAPQIAFTSTPALPQDEVLSRLLFGASLSQLSPTQALRVAAALNNLRNSRSGLDPIGKLRAVSRVDRLRILSADEASGRGAALAAGAYLSRDVYFEIITDARGFTATQLEIAFSKALSLLARTSTFGGYRTEIQYSIDY